MLDIFFAASAFILGGGATGLFLAVELAEAGWSVVLAEKRSRLAAGPSTTNEGMLHRGTYHAAAVQDREQAIETACRCAQGYAKILEIAPEAVEDSFDRSFVLLSPSLDVKEICDRWDEARVPYRPISKREYQAIEPDLDISSFAAVFEVEDKSVNARAIYRNVLRRAKSVGVTILTDVEVDRVDVENNLVHLRSLSGGKSVRVRAQVCICTAGAGIKAFFAESLQTEVPMRYWKSHLLDMPRLSHHNLFCIAPGEITLMHHGAWSIAGLNADAVPVNEPSDEVAPASVELFYQRLQEMFPAFDRAGSVPRACVKVDVGHAVKSKADSTGKLNLSFAYSEPVSGHFWVIPGKMTEVPCVAEALTQVLRERIPSAAPVSGNNVSAAEAITAEIAYRPIDEYGPPRFANRLKRSCA